MNLFLRSTVRYCQKYELFFYSSLSIVVVCHLNFCCCCRFLVHLGELQKGYKAPHFWIMLEKEFKVRSQDYSPSQLGATTYLSLFSCHDTETWLRMWYSTRGIFATKALAQAPHPPPQKKKICLEK